jgi:5-methylcytosine-specific restriction endonuclease McrA
MSEERLCKKCGRTLPATAEYFVASSECNLGIRHTCLDCRHEYDRQARLRPGKREEASARCKAHYVANRQTYLERQSKWRKEHVREVRAQYSRRRAHKLNAPGSHTAQDVLDQYERQSGACYWCNVKVGKEYHVDHVIPHAKGGSDGPENIVIACPTCNLRKGIKMPHEFASAPITIQKLAAVRAAA